MEPIVDRCRVEILELHEFFQRWFRGEVPKDAASLRRVEEALAPAFCLISPDGVAHDRSAVAGLLMNGWGTGHGMQIEVRNFRPRVVDGEMALVTYEEWQSWDGTWRGRFSSTLMSVEPAAPNGVTWRHVHETWLSQGWRG